MTDERDYSKVIDRLEERFRESSPFDRQEIYLARSDAREFIDRCDEEDLAVIRAEGFVLKSEGAFTTTELIADYPTAELERDWRSARKRCNEFMRAFVAAAKPEVELVPALAFSDVPKFVPDERMVFAFVIRPPT